MAEEGGSQLTDLSLSNNSLTEIPTVVSKLTKLKILRLPKNLIRTIPENCLSPSVVTIDLSDNKLEGLPMCIGNLDKLESLNLKGNELKFLPNTMVQLTSLTSLDLSSNPTLDNQALAISANNAEAVKSLLDAIATEFAGRNTKRA